MASHPADPKLRLFSVLVTAARRVVPEPVRTSAGTILFGVTPDVPTSLLTLSSASAPKRALRTGFVLTFILALGGSAAMTLLSGTFSGTDPHRLYFSSGISSRSAQQLPVPSRYRFSRMI